jgi:hypothetical protein
MPNPRTKGIPVKKLLLLALCAILAAGSAEARTLYVNAKRPNNNGNGLKPATAKKTIQAAINIAKAGDTILVYPGNYAPIKAQNKKITIKSVKGASKTKIVKTAKQQDVALAQLGKTYAIQTTRGSRSSAPYTTGRNTTLVGFLLDGKGRDNGDCRLFGVSGGTAKSCSIQRLGKDDSSDAWAAMGATLSGCTVLGNHGYIASGSILYRCRIKGNKANGGYAVTSSRLCNCLVTGNAYFSNSEWEPSLFQRATVINCTVTGNRTHRWSGGASACMAGRSKFSNCILRNNYIQADDREGESGGESIHNVDSGNGYSRTYKDNREPKFVNAAGGNYKLARGSPCIDQGKLTAAQKKLVGSKDLAGAKRIRGKAIDMGCYEY